MSGTQALWWKQAASDLRLYDHLRGVGAEECHLLHYLQMATEKLSKAYLWHSGHAPPKSHAGFARFLKALLDRRSSDLDRIAVVLGFRDRAGIEGWVRGVQGLAYALQNIAPAEADDGPNPEYPWPHAAPTSCPVDHSFKLWTDLSSTASGRKLLQFVSRAVERFEQIA